MSVAVMAQVWQLDLPTTDKLVMLAFADHANDEGRCFPSSGLVAHKSGLSRRHAIRVIHSLIERGLLAVEEEGGGRGKPRVVVVQPEKGDTLSPFAGRTGRTKGDTTSPKEPEDQPLKGDTVSPNEPDSFPQRVTSDPVKGDIAVSPEPSIEPSGTSTDSSNDEESAAPGEPEPIVGDVTPERLLGAWIELQAERPSERDIKKQGAIAKRICQHHSNEQIHLACTGMQRVFPYSDGEPWDLFDLERKFTKAVQAARRAPIERRKGDWLDSLKMPTKEAV